MVRLLISPEPDGSDVERHAHLLLKEQFAKDRAPRGVAVTRAVVPDWCDSCNERCWGRANSNYAMCVKCRGEGKLPIGFVG